MLCIIMMLRIEVPWRRWRGWRGRVGGVADTDMAGVVVDTHTTAYTIKKRE